MPETTAERGKDRARQYYLKIFSCPDALSVDPGHPFLLFRIYLCHWLWHCGLGKWWTSFCPTEDSSGFTTMDLCECNGDPSSTFCQFIGNYQRKSIRFISIHARQSCDALSTDTKCRYFSRRRRCGRSIEFDRRRIEDASLCRGCTFRAWPPSRSWNFAILMEELELHDEDIYLVPESFEYLSFQGITELPLKGDIFLYGIRLFPLFFWW